MKNFYLTDTVYLSGWQYKASQLMDTLSLLQNRVKPIKIKQELLFFQADQYIGSFFTCLLNSVIFLHANSD